MSFSRKSRGPHPAEMSCDYCGKKKEEISFMIGASLGPEWTMWEGTGKTSCDNLGCWQRGELESKEVMRKL